MRFLTLAMAVIFAAPLAHADVTPTVEHDGRYIYYRTSWTRLSKAEQVEIIDASVELLKNEIKDVGTHTFGIKKLSNMLLTSKALDKLTEEAQQSINILDNHSMRELLPAGLFVYVGGSVGAGLALDVKGSSDLGLVIVPTQVTRVDTTTGESISYFNLDWSFVVVPHVFVGLGVRAGASASAGVSLIWGNLNRASDFAGWVGSASADVRLLVGSDVGVSVVHDPKTGNSYAVGTVEFNWGPEAGAAIDGQAGRIISLNRKGEAHFPVKATLEIGPQEQQQPEQPARQPQQ